MLVKAGHRVLVEKGAGEGSGFSDEEYRSAGAEIVSSPTDAWEAEMVLKIKEPIEPEFKFFRDDLLLFTYLHLANPELRELTKTLVEKKVTAIAYETVQLPDGTLPLLEPMSEAAGHMGIIMGAYYLQSHFGGKGVVLGRVAGCRPAEVVVIGGGSVGTGAARAAISLGANATILDIKMDRLRELQELLGDRVTTLYSNRKNVEACVRKADVVVGAVLAPGARAPILVTREMVGKMEPGSVIVDVSIDQGGIFETSRPTTHEHPIYVEEGVIHYCVTDIPGAVPRTSTIALTKVTLPYALQLANLGFIQAVKRDAVLAKGTNVYAGYVTNQAVAKAHGLSYQPLEKLI